jgi:ribose-phosphate pyrophosphokinase
MGTPVVYALPDNDHLGGELARHLHAELGHATIRRFPDGESYLRMHTTVAGRDVIVAATLHDPDSRILPLLFLADTARELGAARIVLVAPYLAYMRQDRRFNPGEAVTSRTFARLVSQCFDGLVTVDPHLHRYPSLDAVYGIPSRIVAAAPHVAEWIQAHVDTPLLVGPDSESEQWVRDVAERAGAPWVVLEKVRRGDRDVEVSVPDVDRWRAHTPVLVDDIISTGRTMIETVKHLRGAGMVAPICVGVHGVFADAAVGALLHAGAERVVTSTTIPRDTSAIDLCRPIAENAALLLERLSHRAAPGRDSA